MSLTSLIHEVGCKFEHLLLEDVEASVCTLLGHPKICPYGKPIPSGKYCDRSGYGRRGSMSEQRRVERPPTRVLIDNLAAVSDDDHLLP